MINKNTVEMEKICRSCMCESLQMRNVFETKNTEEVNSLRLAEMLMACTSIQISSDDGLPVQLCQACESKLDMAFEFKQQCEKADTALRKISGKPSRSNVKAELLDIIVQPDLNIQELAEDADSVCSDPTYSEEKHKRLSTFTCSYCQKVLRTKKGLVFHQRRHTGEQLCCCHLCPAKFTRSNHLTRHLRTHNKLPHNGKLEKVETSMVAERIDDGSAAELNSNSCDDTDAENGLDDEEKDDFLGRRKRLRKKRYSEDRNKNKENEKEKQVMECEFCDRKFKYKKSFIHHMKTEHGMSDESDAPLSSYITQPETAKSDGEEDNEDGEETALNLNNGKDAILNPPTSDDENNVFNDNSPIVPTPKRKPHFCHVCCAKFSRTNHLTRHMTIHRALLTHKCDKCEKAFATDQSLDTHMQNDHIDKPYVCNVCEKPFSRGEHLIRHLKVHDTSSLQENHKCSICEKTFTRSDHLARHTKLHLQQDKRHVCNDCGKAFNRLDNLKTHQRVHTGLKDTSRLHLCIYCGKDFNSSSNMIVHMRRHTGERPYKCSICSKGFPRSHDLKCHERTHSGEKPYLCNLCGKSFNKSNKLLRHTRVHTGERPYACSICGRAFTQSNDLALHMRRHTGARPYVCGVCPARFIQSGQLKSHRRTSGHWMDIPPDLKGGHRVELVTPLTNPPPIKFRTHDKTDLKFKNEDMYEDIKFEPRNIIEHVNVMGIDNDVIPPSYLLGNDKVLQQPHGYFVFASVLNATAQAPVDPGKYKGDMQTCSISSVNSDDTIASSNKIDVVNGSNATFSTANYATTSTEQYNFENYG